MDLTFTERYRLKGQEWARQDGVARRMEKFEDILLSEIFNRSEGNSTERRHIAKAHPEYVSHVERAVQSRTEANELEAEVKAMEMAFRAWQSVNATKRAEMQIL